MDYRSIDYQSAVVGFIGAAFLLSEEPSCAPTPLPLWLVLSLLAITAILIALPLDRSGRRWSTTISVVGVLLFLDLILTWVLLLPSPSSFTLPEVLLFGAWFMLPLSVAHRHFDPHPFALGGVA